MSNINTVVVTGNLTADPEKADSSTTICRLRIAVNGRRKDASGEWVEQAHFFNVTAFAGLADNCLKYLSKGKKIAVNGRLEYREWERDGQKRNAVGIVASDIEFLSARDDSVQTAAAVEDMDDVPF